MKIQSSNIYVYTAKYKPEANRAGMSICGTTVPELSIAIYTEILSGHTVAMVTCCDTKTITCLPLIGQFIDTTIVALIKW